LVFGIAIVDYLTATESLRRLFLERLDHKELVPHFLEPLVLEMVAKVKHLYHAMLKSHYHIAIEGN
jgi:hypothetical protein